MESKNILYESIFALSSLAIIIVSVYLKQWILLCWSVWPIISYVVATSIRITTEKQKLRIINGLIWSGFLWFMFVACLFFMTMDTWTDWIKTLLIASSLSLMTALGYESLKQAKLSDIIHYIRTIAIAQIVTMLIFAYYDSTPSANTSSSVQRQDLPKSPELSQNKSSTIPSPRPSILNFAHRLGVTDLQDLKPIVLEPATSLLSVRNEVNSRM